MDISNVVITKFYISTWNPNYTGWKSGKEEIFIFLFVLFKMKTFRVECVVSVMWLFSNRECLIFEPIFSYNTCIIGPFHALQYLSLGEKEKKKVNVTFSENAKELSGPSSRAESRNVHGVTSACRCVHLAFYPRLVVLVVKYIIINAATRSQKHNRRRVSWQMLRLDFNSTKLW